MCNKYRSRLAIEALLGGFPDLQTPAGLPNLEPRDEISITDTAPIIRLDEGGRPALAQMRWSWPGPGGKPVYNFRSEGRMFSSGRCLIPADGFYEFTDPEPPAPKRGRKTRWLFTMTDEPWFCIAGIVRDAAWSMLTVQPGPDVRALSQPAGGGAGAGGLAHVAAGQRARGGAAAVARRVARGRACELTARCGSPPSTSTASTSACLISSRG